MIYQTNYFVYYTCVDLNLVGNQMVGCGTEEGILFLVTDMCYHRYSYKKKNLLLVHLKENNYYQKF